MKFKEETVSTERVFSGKTISLRVDQVLLPDGRIATREIVEHPGAVAIVALTDQKEIVLVEQYRKAIEHKTLEIPAGKLDPGEHPRQCAIRELKEETGIVSQELELVANYFTTPGFSDEQIHVYMAQNLDWGDSQPDADEFICTTRIPVRDAIAMVVRQEIRDAKTIIGILLAGMRIAGIFNAADAAD